MLIDLYFCSFNVYFCVLGFSVVFFLMYVILEFFCNACSVDHMNNSTMVATNGDP